MSDVGILHLVFLPPGLVQLTTLSKGTRYILKYRTMDEIQN
jgi:hypothetical protein